MLFYKHFLEAKLFKMGRHDLIGCDKPQCMEPKRKHLLATGKS